MTHTEIRVTIDRPLSEVFATYTRPDAFQWASIRNVRWTEGLPWKVGSRLHMEPEDTDGLVVDQVLTDFQHNNCVSFISHFGGVTMQSRVQFRELSNNVTEIHTQLEFVGTFSRILGVPLRAAIERGARLVYQSLKRECEQSGARKGRRSTRVPLRIEVEAQAIGEPVACPGETVVVSCHGALISTAGALRVGMKVELRVIPTERRALADVVPVNPQQPLLSGVGLVTPQNIWGVSIPPPDWLAGDSQSASE